MLLIPQHTSTTSNDGGPEQQIPVDDLATLQEKVLLPSLVHVESST